MSDSQAGTRREGRAASGSGGGTSSVAGANPGNVKVNGARTSTGNHDAVSAAGRLKTEVGPPIDGHANAIPAAKAASHPPPPPPPESFSSWRNAGGHPANTHSSGAPGSNGPVAAPAATAAVPGMPAEAAYNNFYFNTAAAAAAAPAGFSTFSGDIRDSIAAIWSRTSPNGGEAAAAAAAFSGGYGQFAAADAPAAATGQFAANLTGHFATSELGMFGGAGGSDYAAYGQQYGYGAPHYSQWPDTNGGGGGATTNGGNQRGGYASYLQQPDDLSAMSHGRNGGRGDRNVADVQHGLDSMKLTNKGSKNDASNGYAPSSGGQSSAPKKMSWASVASQPAKPQPAPAKAKKPGVLAPPTIISSSLSKPPQPANIAPPPPVPVPVQSLGAVPDMVKNDTMSLGSGGGGGGGGGGSSGGGAGSLGGPANMHPHQQLPPAIPPHHAGVMDGPPHLSGPPPGHPPPYHPHHHPMPPMPPHGAGMMPNHHPGPGPFQQQHPGMQQQQQQQPPRGQNNHHMNHQPTGPPRAPRIANGGGPGVHGMGGGGSPVSPGGHSNNNNVDGGGGGSGGHLDVGPPPEKHPVLENLKSVNNYNPKSFDLNPKGARFFVIKSFSEDDIHRSIKYEIWCSTEHGNKRLDAAFRERNGQGPIYLLFSVNGSGHFCGVAEMLSPVDYSNTGSTVWVQDKFKGQFKVKWIYVKDVPNVQLRHIRLENNENKPVTNSRDTQEVPPEKGKMVLKTIHSFKHMTSIFDDFVHYEKRQKEEEGKKAAANIPGINSNDGGRDHHPHHHHRGGGGGGGGHMRHERNPDHRGNHHGGHRDHHGGYRGDPHHHRGGGGHNEDGGPPPPPHHGGGGGRRGKPRV